jgi:DNA topoisomerase VI subunit B
MPVSLDRTTFQMSRSLEFFSEKELQMQIGFSVPGWPIALLKELIDNALDACETAGILPEIEVTVEPDALTVQANGPGLPESTLARSLDYLIRVSDKAHYVSPSRGQLGNALKCVWAAPFVVRGEHGWVEVIAGGLQHRIAVTLDRIAEQPILHHETVPFVKSGTSVRLHWPEIASFLAVTHRLGFYKSAYELLQEYAAFNPHAAFSYQEPAEEFSQVLPRTSEAWRKWTPPDPTSPHWYTPERLRGLISAYIADERRGGRVRTVREFIGEFSGLTGSAKQKGVTDAAGLGRAYLHDLVDGDDLSTRQVRSLLAAMQDASRRVKPAALGILGEAHVRRHLLREGIDLDSLKYRKIDGFFDEGMPVVIEMAFGWRTDDNDSGGRRILAGINWTPSILFPFPELADWLGEQRIDEDDPVTILAHVAMPRPDFTDRGKSRLALPSQVRSEMAKSVLALTKHWKAMKHQADRDERVSARQRAEYLKRQQPATLNYIAAAAHVMVAAYLEASAQGTLPANARQIMYAARPKVLALTGGNVGPGAATSPKNCCRISSTRIRR